MVHSQKLSIFLEKNIIEVFLEMYTDARWILGNAEKTAHIVKDGDTCDYDIKYTDADGKIQYLEMKSSRNEEITFYLLS